MIENAKGNLLEAPAEALVNTVNTVGVMGKGIALQFRKVYDRMFQVYQEDCKLGRVQIGKMHVYDTGGLVGGPRYIVNFPTKTHWKAKSKIEDIEAGLKDLVHVVREREIRSIAVPPLGCGNGGLDWADVEPLIRRAFEELPAVHVCLFAPTGAPAAEVMPHRTPRPQLTVARAIIVRLIDRYKKGLLEPFVTLLEVQKLMYFMQEAGQPLKLTFSADKYGPYAHNLRHELNRMEGHYTSGFGDGTDSPKKVIELLDGAVDEAFDVLMRADDVNKRMDRVAALIDGFEDPLGMELLATMHWILVQSPKARESQDEAIRLVHDWSSRKRQMMTRAQLAAAWERLTKQDWHFESASIQ